ncbi:MAG TPA: c-type cytochrome [Hyphomonadaceae bacterium]|jgi:mono/diheme cytochrome c family protein|nr:c-type cytochrome [Hyphomonadaceae bacterium]
MSTKHTSNIRAHAAFLLVAAILSTQGCGGRAGAEPAANNSAAAVVTHVEAASQIEAGRYLVKIGGCNDCHTPGFTEQMAMTGKAMPESDWLQGADVGFSGPWGVSYPANLRLSFQNWTEEEFLEVAHKGQGRPPMPWPSLQTMSDSDLKAIYAYVHSLGPKGVMAPVALSPGVEPDRPYLKFEPIMPKAAQKAAK